MSFIGLTGGIACGKSTVSKILTEDYNAVIIDVDQISRELCEPGEIIYNALKLSFTAEEKLDTYFNQDRTLNRKALANLMFTDEQAKKSIENMMHQHIIAEMTLRASKALLDSYEKGIKRFVIFDAPLLIEAGMKPLVKKVIVVHVDPEEQLRRLMNRNGFTKEEALMRINAQMNPYERLKHADYVLNNNGTIEDLKSGLKKIMKELNF